MSFTIAIFPSCNATSVITMEKMEHPSETLDMQTVRIPAGTIALRDDRISRKWLVELQPFAIGRYPVTQAQYAAITGQRPSSTVAAQCPVENVSWLDAVRFCNMLSRAAGLPDCYEIHEDETGASLIPASSGYRLPTEAEWEYACRAGTNSPRYGELDDIAWYRENSAGRTHEVGQKQPNAWGLFDTLGNVWEWCADQYDPEVYGSYRVFRGGGWSDAERGCLATNRRRSHPTFAIDDLGFRVARSPDGTHANW
ncbi:formylglycine-generating enzyme family protein [Paraherbaspirillum soli]|uniref:Formylglycine-generating enzyme family protein n=1 Tax=Paraherbaspirillum soli TaxID=631222 RepID=A0ABW0MHM2_9BURK